MVSKNKRALWPWVVRLRMTLYKGIGKHNSSHSQAINFDGSAVSLRDNMGYVEFGRQRHNLNKLGRGSKDDATNIISRI